MNGRWDNLSLAGIDSHGYHYNSLGLRDTDTPGTGSPWSYTYDFARQFHTATRSDIASQVAQFDYDLAGNVTSGPDPLAPANAVTYGRNRQNQVTTLSHGTVVALRGEVEPAATMAITGPENYSSTQTRDARTFRINVTVPTAASDAYIKLTNIAVLPAFGTLPVAKATNITGVYLPAGTSETFTYDDAGNLTADGRWTYTWDAYNRLTKIESKTWRGQS